MSRGRFRILTLSCPEVGLELCEILVLAAAAVSVVIWRYAIRRSLVIWNGLVMQLIIFLVALSANSREELVVVCSACRFQIATSTSRYDGWTLARSSGSRLRFWFASEFPICVFTSRHFWSSSCRTASFSRTSSWTCLWTPSWVSLSDPPQTPSWTPPSKVTHFLLTALHRTATFGPDPARPSFDLGQTPLGTDPGGVPSEPKHTVKPQWRSKFY